MACLQGIVAAVTIGEGTDRARRSNALAGRVWWHLDRLVSRGTGAIVATLCLLMVTFGVLGSLMTLAVSSGSRENSVWLAIARLLDEPALQEAGPLGRRLVSLVLVLIGIVFIALVIALVVTALQDSLDRVRNGSTPLRHVPDLVILGWSDQLFTLLREFAAEQEGRSAAVVSSRPRAWMDDQLARECGDIRKRLAIQCRTADRASPRELEVVRIREAPRVVILGEPSDRNDAAVVKSIYSTVTASPEDSNQLMIAEVCDRSVTRSLAAVVDRRLLTVDTNELLALVMAQSVREQGMGQLMDEITCHRGCEFYDHEVPPEFFGERFGDLAWSLESASPIGFVRGREVRVLPPLSTPLMPGDLVVVLEESRQELSFAPPTDRNPPAQYGRPAEARLSTQQILMVGWNAIMADATEHLRGFVGEKSRLTVLADRSCMSAREIASLKACTNVDRAVFSGSSGELLDSITRELSSSPVHAVAIVPYREALEPSQSDAATLVALTTVRATLGQQPTRIISELRETKSAALTALMRPDDLVLSDAMTASTIAQLADRPWLDGVLADLLDYRGGLCSLYTVPTRYLRVLPHKSSPFSISAVRACVAVSLRLDFEWTAMCLLIRAHPS
jgi:hypothetical protein